MEFSYGFAPPCETTGPGELLTVLEVRIGSQNRDQPDRQICLALPIIILVGGFDTPEKYESQLG